MSEKKELLMSFVGNCKKLECLKMKKAKLKMEEHARKSFIGKTKEEFKAFMKDHKEKIKAQINKFDPDGKGEKIADEIMENYVARLQKDKGHKMRHMGKHVICCLKKHGEMKKEDLIEKFHLSEKYADKLISKLKYKDIIDKDKAENNILCLSAKGEEVASKIDAHMEEIAECLFDKFNDDEVKNFNNLLDKMKLNIEEEIKKVKKMQEV